MLLHQEEDFPSSSQRMVTGMGDSDLHGARVILLACGSSAAPMSQQELPLGCVGRKVGGGALK